MERFKAVSPIIGRKLESGINVSSYASYPMNLFSPFNYSPDYRIPVPGQVEEYANSVESVWQGLKIIDGATDFRLFKRRPRKRKGNVDGHLFNHEILGIIEAREKIYMPTYFFHVEQNIPKEVKDSLLTRALTEEICFYDIETNLDIEDASSPLAHSVFLAMFFNQYKIDRLNELREKIDLEYLKQEQTHETLAEPLARGIKLYQSRPNHEKDLIRFVLANSQQDLDFFHQRYYSELLKRII